MKVKNIPLIDVESVNISGIGWLDNNLAIRMNDNFLYYYIDVEKYHYDNLLKISEGKCEHDDIKSLGSYLHRNIKGKYRYYRVE